jgi:N-acyl-D-amino-acid deacylase
MSHLSRRALLKATIATAVAGSACSPRGLRVGRADLVIRNGTVFDGLGHDGVAADLAIAAGFVTRIGREISEQGAIEIDATGLVVCPGFVDIHSHGDSRLREDPRLESIVRQGITTIVVGQDGSSPDENLASMEQARPSVNVAAMIGLGSVRANVIGEADRPASAAELAQMTALVERALADGACGASSGLEYAPGAFASTAELTELCRPLAARGLPYATHIRNEDDQLIEAIDEALAVARGARCPLQISHLKTSGLRNWGKLDALFARIAQGIDERIDVAFDRYPYSAYQTGLSNLFPPSARDGGNAAFLSRLSAPESAAQLRNEALAKVEMIGGWDRVMIARVDAPEFHDAIGQRLDAYAKAKGLDPYDATVALLQSGDVSMLGFAMSEQNLERILLHPRAMVCTDGSAAAADPTAGSAQGHPHPRSLGSFPRVLARFVREKQVLTMAQAIYKMCGFPASRLKLDRGVLRIGAPADVVVFDPTTIEDRATFEKPLQYPAGLRAVLVNGQIVLLDGERTPARPGSAVRPKPADDYPRAS